MITEIFGVRPDRDRAEEDAEIRKRRHAGDGAGDVDEASKNVTINNVPSLQIDNMGDGRVLIIKLSLRPAGDWTFREVCTQSCFHFGHHFAQDHPCYGSCKCMYL